MGTNQTPDNVRGFIVPWQMDKKNYWVAQSNATQGDKRAGVPEAQTVTSLLLQTRGLQKDTIQVQTIEAGHVSEGAKFGWKYETDTDLYGHNVPNVLTGVDAVAKLSLFGTAYRPRAAVTTTDGNVLCAVEYFSLTTNNVRVYKISMDGTTTTAFLNTVNLTELNGQSRHPTLITLANGNVLCLFWAIDNNAGTANIQVYQTIDQGATWDLISNRGLQTEIDITGLTLQRITGAATASQCVLFLEAFKSTGTNRNLCYQYASVSQGTKFTYVAQSPASNTIYRVHQPNVVVYNGVYVLSFIRNNDTIGVTQFTDAYDDLFNSLVFANITEIEGVDFAQTISSTLQNGDKYMHMDVDGRIYIYARMLQNDVVSCAFADCAGVEAIEYGRTWHFMGPDPAVTTPQMQHAIVFDPGACGELANIATTFYNGQQLVLCNWDANGTNTFASSVLALSFGMWATQINPRLTGYPTDAQYAHNTQDWAPVDLPTEGGQWTLTTTGTPTITLDADRLDITCAGGVSANYARSIVDNTNGVTMHVALDQQTGGGASSGNYIGVAIQRTTGLPNFGYHVRVYITPTALYLYDMLGSTLIDSVTNLKTGGRALYLHVNNTTGNIVLYYASIHGPRQYATLSGAASSASVTTEQYTWGSTITTIGTTCSWAYVSYSEGNEMGIGIDSTLNGKQYPAIGFYAALDDGLYITTQDGPARNTDEWEIVPQYDTPIERVLFDSYPSRGVTWRSDAVANPDTDLIPATNISWAIDSDNLGVDVRSRNGVVGVHLSNINFKDINLYLYQSGAWVLHSTVNNQSGADFAYERLGNTVRVTSTPSETPFYHYNECAGWYLLLKDGETEILRKIRTNSEGVLNRANTKTIVFTIENALSSDPTTGTNAQLIPNACTVLLHNVTNLAGIRITLPTQQTNEGYYQIGHMVMGPVVIPATQYGRGRTINWEADTDTITGPNGVQYANVRGNGGRTIRVGWVDGVDVTDLFVQNPSPDFYTTKSGTLPEAAIGSAPTTMMGIVQQMQGENKAVVYLPIIDTTGSASHDMINRYHDHCMVTLGSDVQIENVIGDESKNEVLRVGTVVMREVR
jgi:hypothetical protein